MSKYFNRYASTGLGIGKGVVVTRKVIPAGSRDGLMGESTDANYGLSDKNC